MKDLSSAFLSSAIRSGTASKSALGNTTTTLPIPIPGAPGMPLKVVCFNKRLFLFKSIKLPLILALAIGLAS